MLDLGNRTEDSTIYMKWTSNDVNGAAITRATNGTISVYKDANTTQSTAGITDTEDFDSVTGVHHITIDTSADAFYVTGSDYAVVLSGATIDGSTVNAVLAHFRIEKGFDEVDVTKWLGQAVAAVTVNGVPEVDVTHFGGTAGTFSSGRPNANASHLGGTSQTGRDIGASVLLSSGTGTGQLSITSGLLAWNAAWDAEVQSEAEDAIVAHRLDELLNADSDIDGAAPPTVGSVFHELMTKTTGSFTYDQTTDSLEALRDIVGTPSNLGSGATLSANTGDIAITLANVDSSATAILTDTGTTLPGSLATMESAIRGADSDTLKTLSDQLDGLGGGSAGPQVLVDTTIASLASQTSFTLTAGSADNDAYNGAIVVVTDQSTAVQKAVGVVLDYTGGTKTVALAADPGIFTMAVGDAIAVIANASSAPTAAAIRAEMDSNSTKLADILADTATLGAPAGASHAADIAAIKAETASIQTDTNAIETDTQDIQNRLPAVLGSGGRMDSIVNAMAANTLTASALATDAVTEIQNGLSTVTTAQVNAEVDTALADVGLTTTITGRIDAAVSTRATPAQVNAEVVDCLATDTYAELAAVPAATSSLASKIRWLFMLCRNKIIQSATLQSLRNDADSSDVATSSTTDDGTEFTRSEWT